MIHLHNSACWPVTAAASSSQGAAATTSGKQQASHITMGRARTHEEGGGRKEARECGSDGVA